MTYAIARSELFLQRVRAQKTFAVFFVAALLHIPLVLLMREFSILATAHALLTLLVALYYLVHDQTPTRLLYAAGYLSMAEILWRMTKAGVFWEFGKYALVLLFILAILRYRTRLSTLPIIYLVMLLPSVFMLIGSAVDLEKARDQISFNLSGPVSLAFAALYLRQHQFKRQELKKLLLVMIVPVVGLSTLVLYSILRAEAIVFTDESNFLTSGGYGPNQVSAILGLGVLFAWMVFLFEEHLSGFNRLLLFGLVVGFFVQSMLTFSRGGVYNLILPLPMAALAATRLEKRTRNIAIIAVLLVAVVGYFLLPGLDDLTGGLMAQRYSDLDTTGRVDIVTVHLQTFAENPIFGVGPGAATSYALLVGGQIVASHTEYSRLLAEHGLFGAAALLFMVVMLLRVLFSPRSAAEKWLALAFAAWVLLDMSHAAMRLSIISLMFGLSQARFLAEDK